MQSKMKRRAPLRHTKSRKAKVQIHLSIKIAAAFLCVCLLIGLNDKRIINKSASATPAPSSLSLGLKSTPAPSSQNGSAGGSQQSAAYAPIDMPEIEINVYNTQTKAVERMTLNDYLCGVLSAEMPVSFDMEALKAQAVCARTLIAQKAARFGGTGCQSHREADVCTSYSCCQAFHTQAEQKNSFGKNYDAYISRIHEAIDQTNGWIVLYDGLPIEMLYHSTSGGQTEDAIHVFNSDRPYLKSVSSPGEENAPKYSSQFTFTRSEFAKLAAKAAGLKSIDPKKLEDLIKIESRYLSGRVEHLKISTQTITGVKARDAFGLYSANFTIRYEGDTVLVDVRGSGHGVGMSQVGADAMARTGKTWDQIICHYFTGVTLGSMLTLTD